MTGGRRALHARGHLVPEEMFPAGVPAIRVRRVTLPGGLTLRLAEAGGANAPPVLLLHGWGASIYMWREWFGTLAAAGYRPIAVDLPGHGLSDKPDAPDEYSVDRQVGILRALLDAEALVGAAVVAQSMGASIALELALREPAAIGPLALINPSSFGDVRGVALAQLVSPALVERTAMWVTPRWVVARVHRRVYTHPSRITRRDVDEYWAPAQLAGCARALWLLLREFRWTRAPVALMTRRLRGLSRPPLVLLGARDALVRDALPYAEALIRAGAPIELLVVPDGGHAMNEEEPHFVMGPVLAMLRGTPPGDAIAE